jgi:hypothetical protein
MRTTIKIKKVRSNLASRKAGQRLEYPPSGPKYDLSKQIVKASKK